MSDTLIVLHTAIAIIVIVLLILVVRVDPVISLVIGTIYLGLAAGLGFEDTIGTIAQGFGDIMIEVGLLGAYLLAWRTLPDERVGEAMNEGFDATGQILLITGLGDLWER